MRKVMIVLGCLALLVMASCGAAPVYNFYQPFAATNNPVGNLVGESRDTEGGILQAAQNGGITRIGTVDIIHRLEQGVYKRIIRVTGTADGSRSFNETPGFSE